jgi:hypothetical protein
MGELRVVEVGGTGELRPPKKERAENRALPKAAGPENCAPPKKASA